MNISKKKYFNLTGKTNQFINIGYGKDISIKDLAKLICKVANYKCKIEYDKSKPNGTPRKILDNKIAKRYHWRSNIKLKKGFQLTYQDFLKNYQ